MKKHIVLLSKDATLPEYFGPYGSKFTKTPNIDELAEKGTVFLNHYTAAPSTSMAFDAMFTGKWPYEMPYSHYSEVDDYKGTTLFDILHSQGYECHLLWSSNYVDKAEKFTKCYGKHTIHHDQMKFNQSCGFNAKYSKRNRERDELLAEKTFRQIIDEIDTIDYQEKNIFLWVHMPHCILGRISYGDDIVYFDRLVGEMRSRFGDDSIFVTADHGHMNGQKHKVGYGFDVYYNAVHIPLITPRINGLKTIEYPTSNVQLISILAEKIIAPLPYIICDSAYYAQPNRKIAVIKGDFFYIYNKRGKREELYNIRLDPMQNIDFSKGFLWKDKDRMCKTDYRQVVLFDEWDSVDSTLKELRAIKNRIWKKGSFFVELKNKLHSIKVKCIHFTKGLLRKIKK